MKRKILLALLSLASLVALYLLLWPVTIEPAAWPPPTAPPLAGVYESNSRLASAERLVVGGHAPEGVAVAADGRIYAGVEGGRIFRLQPDGTRPELFADTRGRPLGLDFDRDGNLVVADAYQGLLSIAPDGRVNVLTKEAGGRRLGCPNDLDIAADGTVYFTDATDRPLSEYTLDIIEHRPLGRFLAYDPATKQTRVLIDQLHFANGVALGPGEDFALVVETGEYKVWRYWLKGPRAGEREVFVENLPGFPDNITFNGTDTFWLALVTPRNSLLDGLLPRPSLRKVVVRLPSFLQPAPERYGFVVGLSPEGRVTRNLQDPSGEHYAMVSSALERGGALYLGSLHEDSVGRVRLDR
ncbi:MAG: SMP-30/gluconolactonase/LRE family protein [Acidobacteriota bacterium]|nr:SMP-30/gluconolactonase/LRE family protein [Acidobacteriota bacterium]